MGQTPEAGLAGDVCAITDTGMFCVPDVYDSTLGRDHVVLGAALTAAVDR